MIDNRPVVKVPDHKDNISFAMYIGNKEVSKRLGIDLRGTNSLGLVYEILSSSRGNGSRKSLIV